MLSRNQIIAACCLIMSCALSSAAIAQAQDQTRGDSSDASEITSTLHRYYQWVLANHDTVMRSEPRLVDVPGATKFYLDRSSEQEFIDGFMDSGIFSAGFPAAVSRYYAKYQKEFAAYSQAEFDEIAHDGRGPLMEVEDMDVFFCAQEYEYNDAYINSIQLRHLEINGDRASVVTIFPFEWETQFKLEKVDGQWLISAFCVYE